MDEAEATNPGKSDVAYRLRRGAGGVSAWFQDRVRNKWARRALWLLGGIVILFSLFWVIFARDLPDARTLLAYEPPLPTIVRDVNGQPVYSYARERRVQLQYADFPPMLIHAYLAAEDKTFFSHHGVDIPGFFGAVFDYVRKFGSGERAKGGSTITQQVAKNLLIGDAYSPTRKIKEMILAYRMENVLTKQQILELYLNQIFLGRNAYGVQAAARAYFDKDVGELKLNEMAYLAILPKGPANYRPESETGYQRAIERRNWALGEMRKNGWVNDAQYREALATPLGAVRQRGSPYGTAGGYYIEEIRRRLMEKFGEKASDGPNSIYAGGLWVRSPLDPVMQDHAEEALRAGLIRYDAGKGWSGPVGEIQMSDNWRRDLAVSNIGIDYQDWKAALVVSKNAGAAELGFTDGTTGTLPASGAQMLYRRTDRPAFDSLKAGDL
ncbi:MAG: transglycosylase domain-containing protein, partial [Sphingobium phenoxybenzoativorans]